ncbi:MAG: DUF998 domain-containing protein [Nitrososphaeria archaeon]
MIKLAKALGILGVTLPYLFIATSITLSPWFDFYENALSDLGSISRNGLIAFIFNFGLVISGSLVSLFTLVLSSQKRSWKFLLWTPLLLIDAVDLSLIGIFNVDAGRIHSILSIVFFVTAIVTMFVYSYLSWPLQSPYVGALALLFGLTSVLLWSVRWPWSNVAIQESATAIMTSIWLVLVTIKNV